ncbi:hypothetical protein AD16_4517 [Escherichia coli 3-267-03_S4_C2]|nr:hypothetical protein AA98_2108 [Escherichia coli 2-011-08_S1_C1]KDU22660.1 hypothetical protein AD16_4517 [Escherichia coli 3-267-03_S4_C2]KDU32428.1 hypothetical protein AD17_0479 [Escherichia coli 3-373-03_S4_C2]KDU50297.1 hypothetical protein AC89_4260 [Escherichia coli 3-373-03_S4_C1]KEL27907.1 hypothetical protein AD44_0627 [Escherichia coli 3-373-03_S4_C3]KEL79664.1 hypothetical protein AC22_4611 [Escherichia coli 5-366-08_S3_C2]KEO08296.1 hypothetical protein AD29_4923 [Escherichia 
MVVSPLKVFSPPVWLGVDTKITVAKGNGLMPIFNCYLQLNK